jgi:hypothetical protein
VIELHPNRVVLGRTYEKFSIPAQYAGKIEGRSSYARLGLMVHCSGDFINPGWRGQMPLELVSHSSTRIRLTPLMPIAQLMLVKVEGDPDRTYGDRSLASKYFDDDGGPSYWWRDPLLNDLLERLGKLNLPEGFERHLTEAIESADLPIEVLDRLDTYVADRRIGDLNNADDTLAEFATLEDRRRTRYHLLRRFSGGLAAVLVSTALGSLFLAPYTPLHILSWVLALASIVGALLVFLRGDREFFGGAELRRMPPRESRTTQ